jgi:outer membrane protein TolC
MTRKIFLIVTVSAVSLLAGCKGVQRPEERQARAELSKVEGSLRPRGEHVAPQLPESGAPLNEFLKFAMLNNPQVEAAYYDWAGSVERITVERSMPDPKLTFQAYIQNALTSLMPGLMQDFPGRGKLKTAARVASEESRGKYAAFESSVLQTAFSVKKAYYELALLDEKVSISRQTLALLGDLEASARSQNEVGKATLQDVYRAQIEQDQLTAEVDNLAHSRIALLAQFKGALGLRRDQPAPAPSPGFEPTSLEVSGDDLLDAALARNPRLKSMQAELRVAEASIAMARTSRSPDFSAGLQAEVYSPPFYWPEASMTLPIWRDKIAAQIASAQANRQAAQARLTAEEISVTVDLIMKLHEFWETTRNLTLFREKLIPKAGASLKIARAAYLSGQTDFFNLIDSEKTLVGFQLQEAEARAQREIILAELSISMAGIAPENAPILR